MLVILASDEHLWQTGPNVNSTRAFLDSMPSPRHKLSRVSLIATVLSVTMFFGLALCYQSPPKDSVRTFLVTGDSVRTHRIALCPGLTFSDAVEQGRKCVGMGTPDKAQLKRWRTWSTSRAGFRVVHQLRLALGVLGLSEWEQQLTEWEWNQASQIVKSSWDEYTNVPDSMPLIAGDKVSVWWDP